VATQQQFIDFLSEIEPSPTTKLVCSSAHTTLRGKLEQHETYKHIHDNTYLSGSYARNTALRPRQSNGTLRRPDVDIIVVTNHTRSDLPSNVIATLRGEKQAQVDGYEGLRSLEVIIAAYRSARDGVRVGLPLVF